MVHMPPVSCPASCHMTSIGGAGDIGGGGGGGREGVVRHMVTSSGEARLHESPEGIHDVPKDLRGMLLHIVADTERPA